MPVRSRATFLRPNELYKIRVCCLGSAVSIFFMCFPTTSRSVLSFCRSAPDMLMNVDGATNMFLWLLAWLYSSLCCFIYISP